MAKLDRLTRDPCCPGTLHDAWVPLVAADIPHATEVTVDRLPTAAAFDEARRTAERSRSAPAAERARRPSADRPTLPPAASH